MDPAFCLFMLTCFTIERPFCPPGCICYDAPLNGVSGTDAQTIVCDSPNSLNNPLAFGSKPINSLVVSKSSTPILIQNPIQSNSQFSPISVLFDSTEILKPGIGQKSIFYLLNGNTVKYLAIVASTNIQIDWNDLKHLTNLDTLYIENSNLPNLDSTFSELSLPNLRTLHIKYSKLLYIDREALFGKEASLQKLLLSGNQLRNLLWLCQPTRKFPNLYHLDLNQNLLSTIPENLHTFVPNLQTLNVAQNRLNYYSLALLSPWLEIPDFILEQTSRDQNGKDIFSKIFYTTEMATLRQNILSSPSSKMWPAFFLESLMQNVRYTSPTGVYLWDILNDPSVTQYTHFPDNLYLNAKGKLQLGKAINTNEDKISGNDLTGFTFDSVTNLETYRTSRDYLKTVLQKETALRIGLFGRRMFSHFIGQSLLPEANIRLMADLLLDFLDEAAQMKVDVVLVMWKSDDIDLTKTDHIYGFDVKGPAENAAHLILARLNGHAALIGIEIMHGFLAKHQIGAWNDITPAKCAFTHDAIEWEMIFVGASSQLISQNIPNKLSGLSVTADCQLCLPLALYKSCRIHMMLNSYPVPDFDFLTFYSSTGGSSLPEGQEVFGFEKIEKSKLSFFDVRDDLTRSNSRGIFYLISETTGKNLAKVQKIESFATGHFIIK